MYVDLSSWILFTVETRYYNTVLRNIYFSVVCLFIFQSEQDIFIYFYIKIYLFKKIVSLYNLL